MMQGSILVTGATGFLGQHLVRSLRQRGLPVRALVRPRARSGDPMLHALETQGVQIIYGDLNDQSAMRTALCDVRGVFHLAGRLFAPGIAEAEYKRIHIEGTRNLIASCAEASSPPLIVHCSTTGVLGPTGTVPADEDAALRPSNSYERTKAIGEQLALALARQHGLALVVARPALVYGPGDLHLLGWFRSIRRGYYRVIGSGHNMLHPIYIDDLIDGLLRCAETPAASGRVYHLVGDHPLPIRELGAEIARALGRRPARMPLPLPLARGAAALLEALPGISPERLPLTQSRITFMTESRAYCGARAARELGFVPQVPLAEGLRRTVAWYHSEGLL
jgi:nucleoside-diphosphate-sugar epimerase